jgi:hypothetical protein
MVEEIETAWKAGDILHFYDCMDVPRKVLVMYLSDHPHMKHAARVLFIREGRTFSVNKASLSAIVDIPETAEDRAWKVWGDK